MSFVSRFDDFQRRHPAAGYPLAVLYKYFDDQGGYLAALITYYGFVSLFPLMLLFTAVLGLVLQHHEGLKEQIITSLMDYIPVVGQQLNEPPGLSGSIVAIIIGVVGAIYGGLGGSVACQNAMNDVWAVPRNTRPNPVLVRIRGFVLLFTVGLTLVLLAIVSLVVSTMGLGGTPGSVLTLLGTSVLVFALFVFAFRFGTTRRVSTSDVFAGALVATVGWQILQHSGNYYVHHVVARTKDANSIFATVLGLLAFIYLASVILVIALEINAVRVDELYPRALLTEFTDDVDLLRGDVRTYTRIAQAQRNKGFEKVTVSFDNPRGDNDWTEPAPPGAGPPASTDDT